MGIIVLFCEHHDETKEFKKHPCKHTRLIGRGTDMIQAIYKAFFTYVVIFKRCCFHFHHFITEFIISLQNFHHSLQNLATSGIQRKIPTYNKSCCYYPVIESSRNGSLLQCSCLENPMDRGSWLARVGHDLMTKPPPPDILLERNTANTRKCTDSVSTTPRHSYHPDWRNAEIFAIFSQIYFNKEENHTDAIERFSYPSLPKTLMLQSVVCPFSSMFYTFITQKCINTI